MLDRFDDVCFVTHVSARFILPLDMLRRAPYSYDFLKLMIIFLKDSIWTIDRLSTRGKNGMCSLSSRKCWQAHRTTCMDVSRRFACSVRPTYVVFFVQRFGHILPFFCLCLLTAPPQPPSVVLTSQDLPACDGMIKVGNSNVCSVMVGWLRASMRWVCPCVLGNYPKPGSNLLGSA